MMSKDYLSQEEIDALLRQTSEDNDSGSEAAADSQIGTYLTPIEQDALGEIGNITFGSAATALSTLLGKKVDITTPQVTIVKRDKLDVEFPRPHVAVSVSYVEGFQGINSLVIKSMDAQIIADLMLGGEGNVSNGDELNEIHISAVQEAMNQMMGSSATSMSTIFNRLVNISPPGIDILDIEKGNGIGQLPPDDVFIKVSFKIKVGDLIDSTIMQLLPVDFAKQMVDSLMGGGSTDPHSEPAPKASSNAEQPASAPQPPALASAPAADISEQPQVSFSGLPPEQQSQANDPQLPYGVPMQPQHGMPMHPQSGLPVQPPYGVPMQMPGGAPSQPAGANTYGNAVNRSVNVQPVQFANFQGGSFAHGDDTNLNLLLDIPLKVTVELGRTQKQIKDILELSQGSIIELDKLAGEPVDILVNNKLIAKGEVVVIDENFGVRVTDIVSQWDRIAKIQ
ncbi:flagellar motor switch phosphatase FliY [Paenibacillus beijingensis]|uniref:Flagellar motor switch protein FliN n=1 Tax=Paenibacillus beijingensis TaxID=1126833 RepID=A0A0D5NNI4_9BACL|nr:flagellar motor switch phosphatase FliY [Paenibacillus beijingensis]AJY76577.1 flagellar motor switch protein FliN [Paenibacillus beijingensis]